MPRAGTAGRALDAEIHSRKGEAALRARTMPLRCAGSAALELYPDEGEYHAHYGWVLYLCHPSDTAMAAEAMEHVRRALKLEPIARSPTSSWAACTRRSGQDERPRRCSCAR